MALDIPPKKDAKGKFLPGNASGGRRPRQLEQRYQEAFNSTVKVEDWVQIINRAVRDAKAGEHQARKWLSDNLVGLPTQRQEIKMDGDQQIVFMLPGALGKQILAETKGEE